MENSLENLTSFILEKANAEAEGLMEAARRDADTACAEKLEKLGDMLARQRDQLSTQSEQRIQIAVRQTAANINKERTRYVSKLIDTLFEDAEAALCAMSADEFLRFFHNALESLPLAGEFKVLLGQRSAEKLNEQQRMGLECTTEQYRLVLAEDTIANQGGFMLEQTPIEYSFLFVDLLSEIKHQESPRLLKRLID